MNEYAAAELDRITAGSHDVKEIAMVLVWLLPDFGRLTITTGYHDIC